MNIQLSRLTLRGLLFFVFFSLGATSAMAQRPEPKKTMVMGHTMYTVLNPGAIPAIFEPTFMTIDEAAKFYHPDEPLMAVIDGDSAKAYSTWHLDAHEIVNDYINGKAITVTW